MLNDNKNIKNMKEDEKGTRTPEINEHLNLKCGESLKDRKKKKKAQA